MRKKGLKSSDGKDRLRFLKAKVEREIHLQSFQDSTKLQTDRGLNTSFEIVSTKGSSPVKYEPMKSILLKKNSVAESGLHIAKQRKFRILRSKILQRKPTIEEVETFTRIGLLGEGGSSYVYLVEDKATLKRMVLKEYKKSTRKALKQYLIGKSLSHKGLVEYYDHKDNQIFMEYIEEDRTRCPPIILAYKLAQTISYLHANNVCHTDIKPKNIIVTGTGLKLIDFGESMKGQLWKKGRTGTYGYMAPEMFEENFWNGKQVDVWSFGMVCKDWRLHQVAEFCLVQKQYRPTIQQVLAHPAFKGCASFA